MLLKSTALNNEKGIYSVFFCSVRLESKNDRNEIENENDRNGKRKKG